MPRKKYEQIRAKKAANTTLQNLYQEKKSQIRAEKAPYAAVQKPMPGKRNTKIRAMNRLTLPCKNYDKKKNA